MSVFPYPEARAPAAPPGRTRARCWRRGQGRGSGCGGRSCRRLVVVVERRDLSEEERVNFLVAEEPAAVVCLVANEGGIVEARARAKQQWASAPLRLFDGMPIGVRHVRRSPGHPAGKPRAKRAIKRSPGALEWL